MACISKISSAIAYDCETGNTGLVSALLINKQDIASISFDASIPVLVRSIALNAGATAYKIDTVKRVLTTSEALKINEGAPNAYAHSATVVVTAPVATSLFGGIINPVANGSFVILTRALRSTSSPTTLDVCRPFGLYYGMSATSVDRSSHDNGGWFTITMATPEQFIGEDALSLDPSVYDTLYAAAVG